MRKNAQLVKKRELHYLTPYGRDKYSQRLQELSEDRQRLVENLRTAMNEQASEREDLAETLRLLRQTEDEIVRVDSIVKNSVVRTHNASDAISIGAKVTLQTDSQQQVITLVDSIEADPEIGHISDISPLGALLLNKQTNQQVTVQTPRGQHTYEILLIE